MADQHDATAKPRKRSRIKTFLLVLLAVISLIVAGAAIIGEQYHGPRDLAGVTSMMPGVPLFPFTEIAPANRTVQRLLAAPLLLMRLQGARTAEAVLLQVPAEHDFVLDWYRRAAPYQDWKKLQESKQSNGTRLLFVRNREVLQVIIGHTSKESITPIQLIYLDGVSDTQITRMQAESRIGVQ
jgi:uncharacterized membrane protein YgcG